MRKSIIFAIIFFLIIGCITGIYIYKKSYKKEVKIGSEQLVEDECTMTADAYGNSTNTVIQANSEEEKIGTTTKITKKIYYKSCNHLIEETGKVTSDLINLTEAEFKELYSDWEVQKFTTSEVVIYKEVDDFCNQHYILREENGYITIYKVDMQGNETLYNTTDIWTGYLSEDDLKGIQEGLKVYTTKELNKLIEDFE